MEIARRVNLDMHLADKAESTQVAYKSAINEFQTWLNGSQFTVSKFRAWLAELSETQAPMTVNRKRSAIVFLAKSVRDDAMGEYDDDPERAHRLDVRYSAIKSVKTRKVRGQRLGNWLTEDEVKLLFEATDDSETLLAIALMVGCGLRISELYKLDGLIETRNGRTVIANLEFKGRVRSIPVPEWVSKRIGDGAVLSTVSRASSANSFKTIMSRKVNRALKAAGMEHITPHDLRRTAARMWYDNGSDVYQIQLLLGHGDSKTTAAYIGASLKFEDSPVDSVSFTF